MRKKTAEIKIRCTPDFKVFIKELADKYNKSMSELVEVGFKKFDKKYNKSLVLQNSVDPELIRQLARIGNNINQIARSLNSNKNADFLESLIVLKSIENDISNLTRVYTNDN